MGAESAGPVSARQDVAYFLKQLGGCRGKRSGEDAVLDRRLWHEHPQPVKVASHAA